MKKIDENHCAQTSDAACVPEEESAFDVSTSALSRLMNAVRTARKKGYPFILLDTLEVEVVRDVAYHPDNPVGHCCVQGKGALQLLEGEETAGVDNCVNVVWYDLDSEPRLAKENGYDLDKAPVLWIMVMEAGSGAYALGAAGKKREFLRGFALKHYLNHEIPSYVLLYGDPSALPEDLKNYTHIVDVPYPAVPEIQWRIRERLKKSPWGRADADSAEIRRSVDAKIREIAQNMRGLTYAEVDRLADYLLSEVVEGKILFLAEETVWKKVIAEHKQQSLKRNGNLLTLEKEEKRKMSGMGRLIHWVEENKYRVTVEGAHHVMLETGVSAPKGILLHGTPGCGKSDVATLLQQEWRLPLLKMDMGRLMGGLLGDSERLMRNALRQAEACSPCILFVDEIEKALSGISGGNNVNDSVRRMISYLLNWLSSDRGEDACFVYCTANSLEGLPPELYRKGRLDVLFSVALPTCSECADIFLAQLENRRMKAQKAHECDNGAAGDWVLFKGESAQWKKAIRERLIEGENLSLLHPQRKGAPERESLFVSGADIVEIVNQALLLCYGPERDAQGKRSDPPVFQTKPPLDFDEFIVAAQEIISSPTMRASGSGEGNLKKLAKGYVSSMRGAFIPVSAEDEVLFDPEDYSIREEKVMGTEQNWVCIKDSERRKKYEGTESSVSNAAGSYDRALYAALIRHIERIREPEE